MSLGQFILAGNWLLEGAFKEKFKRLQKSPLFLVLIAPYVFLVLGVLWSNDYNYAAHDLRIKLPLLLLPLFFASAKPIQKREWKILLLVYLGSLFILSLFSYYKLIEYFGDEIVDKRQLSIRISHIRYGLNLALASLLSLYFFKLYGKKGHWPMGLLSVWFFVSLFSFQLYTGLSCFFIALFFIAIYKILESKNRKLQLGIFTGIGFITFLLAFQIHEVKNDFQKKVNLAYNQEETQGKQTEAGEKYWHNKALRQKENGVYVWRFIAWNELKTSWNKRSKLKFGDKDLRNQDLSATLCRFLSSKGLKKDAKAVNSLQENEIEAIENGIANVYFLNHGALKNRIYSIFYEFDRYHKTNYANGYSLVMRIEYWETAVNIIEQNFLIGVGTGDVNRAFKTQYEKDDTQLDEKYRKRTHNQYLSIFVSIGFLGFFVFLFSLVYPLSRLKSNPFALPYLSFFIIAVISFLTEDTLETQAGVTFFAFFNSFFLLGIAQSQID